MWGDVSTGKSSVVESYFEALHGTQKDYVFLNCTEAFTPKTIFERILNTFNNSYPTFPPAPNAKAYIKCSQLPNFIELLTSVISKRPEVFTWFLVNIPPFLSLTFIEFFFKKILVNLRNLKVYYGGFLE